MPSRRPSKVADIRGRALVIHESGDNYTDSPENGGSKSYAAKLVTGWGKEGGVSVTVRADHISS